MLEDTEVLISNKFSAIENNNKKHRYLTFSTSIFGKLQYI